MRRAFAVLVTVLLPLASVAGEPTVVVLEDNELIEEMCQRIEKLEKRVAELESQLAPRPASGPKSSVTPTPSYGQHPSIRKSTRKSTAVIRVSFPSSLEGCVETGMRASEIEHRSRMENYWNNPGLEPPDPTRQQWPQRSFRQDAR